MTNLAIGRLAAALAADHGPQSLVIEHPLCSRCDVDLADGETCVPEAMAANGELAA